MKRRRLDDQQRYSDDGPFHPPHAGFHGDSAWYSQQQMREENIRRLDHFAFSAYQEALDQGRAVTVASVVSDMLGRIGAHSLESFGVQMQQIPSLRTLSSIEGKVNAFIISYVAGNRISTLFDLVRSLCQEEKVASFEDLGLGPVVTHPLVVQHFGFGLKEVYRITASDVVQYVVEMIDAGKKVEPESLLSFIAEQKGVDVNNLCVKVQGLGMYVSIVRKTRKKEQDDYLSWKAKLERPTNESALKVHEFLSSIQEEKKKGNKHIRFPSVSDSEEDAGLNQTISQRYSTCPYPSAAEERKKFAAPTRLENDKPTKLKHATDYDFSISNIAINTFTATWQNACQTLSLSEVLKQMLGRIEDNTLKMKMFSLFKRFPARHLLNIAVESMAGEMRVPPFANIEDESHDFSIDAASKMEFAAKWKTACSSLSVSEVLERLITSKKGTRISKHFRSYPALEILNVAIASIKSGVVASNDKYESDAKDNIADSTAEAHLTTDPNSRVDADISEKVFTAIKNHFSLYVPDVTTETNGLLNLLKWLIDCEKHLHDTFTKNVFVSLGCKDFLQYLERKLTNMSTMENNKLLMPTARRKEVPRHRIEAFISQAWHARSDRKTSVRDDIMALCCEQFHLGSIEEVALKGIQDMTEFSQGTSHDMLYFSAALLGDQHADYFGSKSNIKVGKLGSMTNMDAERRLAKAPMLCDLELWSQWVAIFEPQLGPLLDFLEHDRGNSSIIGLVTKSRGIIRVDGEARIEKFLTAVTQGKSRDAATQLISLVVLHGGLENTPKELLRSHAVKGMEVYFGISTVRHYDETGRGRKTNTKQHDRLGSFVLECLTSVPLEFSLFATEVLFRALETLVPDAASLVLQCCTNDNDHLVLHHLGLTMGIAEWINDYNSLHNSLDATKSFLTSSEHIQKKPKLVEERSSLAFRPVEIKSQAVEEEARSNFSGDSVVSLDDSQESEARKLIRSIRYEEFGLDSDSPESTLLAKQHARMGRALQCLSQNLYSEDCHFILELLQNADDNSYPPGKLATLAFVIEKQRIVVLNNEQGFTAKNIRALCDVGNSTKLGQPSGYIGHKGIGFKSVFRVTDSPRIHSNGFHVKFDITESSLGFILPTLVESPSDKAYFQRIFSEVMGEDGMNTRIDLPLRSSVMEATGSRTVSSMFQDLQPSLLLFLHKLRTLAVRDEVDGAFRVMRRHDLGDNLVKLTDGERTRTFLMVRQSLDAPVERSGVSNTELALAFELNEVQDGIYESRPVQQEVFAFLPVRSYGMKFIVQGDFILPSSREDLDRDSVWNQWLRSEIPKLFLHAVESFKSSGVFGGRFEAITSYLSFVPIEGEVLGFFSALPRIILSQLRGVPCLPVEGANSWALPCTTLRGWHDGVRTLVPDNMLKEHLGLYYLDRQVVLTDVLASSLGVSVYGVDTLVNVLKGVARKLETLGVSWLRKCLIEMYKCIIFQRQGSSLQKQEYLRKELRNVPFIPLSSGEFTSLDAGAVWFLDSEAAQYHSKSFIALYSDIRTVDPLFITGAAEDVGEASIIKEMLKEVGVNVVSAHDIIKNHILPAMSNANCLEKDSTLVVQYLAYCMLHFELDKCQSCDVEKPVFLSELKQTAVVLTDQGLRRVGHDSIHFSKKMGNPVDVKSIFEEADVVWSEVKDDYFDFHSSTNLWRKFLEDLGVSDFIKVLPANTVITDKSTTIWKDENWKGNNEGSWTVRDWDSPELVDILKALARTDEEPGKVEQCGHFLLALDKLWDKHYDQFSKAVYSQNGQEADCASSIVLQMRQFAWVKSSDGQLCRPTKMLYRVDTVEKLLGCHACYAEPQIQSKGLVGALGLRTKVYLDDVVNLLKSLKRNESFSESLSHMERVYTFLWENADDRKLRKLFRSSSIFLPLARSKKRNKNVLGKLYARAQVAWDDPFEFENVKGGLHEALSVRTVSKFYPGLREFFVERCLIPETPEFDMYIDMLQQVTASYAPSLVLEKVLKLFAEWSLEIETGKLDVNELQRRKDLVLKNRTPILPTTQDTWVGLTNSNNFVCWCDDQSLADMFGDLSNIVHFVDLGNQEATKFRNKSPLPFLKALGLRPFSEIVQREAIVYGTTGYAELETIISMVLSYAQRFLMQFYAEAYEEMLASKAHEQIQGIQCYIADKVFYQYTLTDGRVASCQRTECDCVLQGNKLHVSSSHSKDYASIFLEFSRLFFGGKTNAHLANFLHLTTLQAIANPDSDLESSSQHLKPLPEEHTPWQVGEKQAGGVVRNLSADSILERQRLKMSTARSSKGPNGPGSSNGSPGAFTFEQQRQQPSITLNVSRFVEEKVDNGWGWSANTSVLQRESLYTQSANPELQELTGRQGEKLVYEHLCAKYGNTAKVKWLNENVETGSSYDIVVEKGKGDLEFIEVKSTRSSSKDWFEMSSFEWEAAVRMKERYTIYRVTLLLNKQQQQARLMILNNPVQLCRDKVLRLAIIAPQER